MASSSKTYVILLLAATTVGGALLAWRQYGELVELRAAALNRDERADLQKRVWDLEKTNRELQSRLSGQRGAADELLALPDGSVPPTRPDGGRGDPRGRGGFDRQALALRELINKPEVQAMVNQGQRLAIESRYAALFRNLNLPPEQTERLTALLAERTTTMMDLLSAARDQGIDPRENPDAFRKLVAEAQNEINASIKSLIGDQGFAQLSSYEQTLPQRAVVNELQQRLSYSSAPLTAAQSEQLVQILAANPPAPPNGPATANEPSARPGPPPGPRGPDLGALLGGMGGPGPGGPEGGRGAAVTPAAVAQAQTILTPPQLTALQQMQQQQQTQQQLRNLVNEALGSGPAGGGGPPGATKSGRRGGG